MEKKLMLGNAAVARGAYEAGVKVASAYPGTPSTEITEEIAKLGDVYCEWSPNEKVALEVGVGAAIGGARALVCMKHVGLNVAADPLFTAAYTGVSGGLVIVVADDPGMHSSQNEQDSRFYARFSFVPMLEPSSSQEAKEFVKRAFELSERYDTPVLLRLTTRVSHSQGFVELEKPAAPVVKEYKKDIAKYVMMPGLAKKRHVVVEQRTDRLKADAETLDLNAEELADKKLGVVCSGITYQYVKEVLPKASVFKLGMVNPLPLERLKAFSEKVERLVVIEELEPFFEDQLKAAGIACEGKSIFSVQGEILAGDIRERLLGEKTPAAAKDLPARPPVMCAGCPHRGVFYVLNKLKMVVTGDIGCYTLGAVAPLNAVDAVVCMGASIGMAHGLEKAHGRDFSRHTVAVIGDSTFVHSGITGLINAVYNKSNITVMILDNSTTGMTGHQDHPATGKTVRGEETYALDLAAVCKAAGAANVRTVDPFDLKGVEQAVKEETAKDGVSVIIAKRACVLKAKAFYPALTVTDACVNCKACMKLGCPAITSGAKSVTIDKALCVGCGLCAAVCPTGAIRGREEK